MGKLLLIDGNSIGNAANNSTVLTVGKLQTQAIFGYLRSINDLMHMYPGWTILNLWDGRAQWRFDMHPAYKSNRGKDPKSWAKREAYKQQTPFIQLGLRHLGLRQMTVMNMEADDVAGYMVKSLMQQNPDNEIVLVTGDKDWLQLLRPNVLWFDKRYDRKCNIHTLFDMTGFKTPEAFLQGKCLEGDKSDVISGVGGLGEKLTPEFMAEFDSVENFWHLVDTGAFVPKYARHKNLALPEGRAIFQRNMKLMSLLDVPRPDPAQTKVDMGTPNPDAFRQFCEKLAFHSILRDWNNFTAPFFKDAA